MELSERASERTTELNKVCILQVSEHLPQSGGCIHIHMYMYMYLDWLPVDRFPVDWLPMELPMDVELLPVGMVAFGSLACRPGCLGLGSMYNRNTIFHIYTSMHMYMHIHVYVYVDIYTFVHVYLWIYMYMEVCAYM